MSDDPLRVDLCHDHFERLVADDVCNTCPSHVENEAVCLAMSAVLAAGDPSAKDSAIVSELKSLRRQQSELLDRLKALEHRLVGNGQPGLVSRVSVLEARQDDRKHHTGSIVAIAGVLASWIGIAALFFGRD